MGKENHVFAPAYKEKDMEELVQICDHVIFNSFAQYEKYQHYFLQQECTASARDPREPGVLHTGRA